MIYEVKYSFHDLLIDKAFLYTALGFGPDILPEPFDEYVALSFSETAALCDIRCAFSFQESVQYSSQKGEIILNDTVFNTGKKVGKAFRNSEGIALFICTVGAGISERSNELLSGENPALGYVFDLVGSLVAEAAADLLQEDIRKMVSSKGWTITNRYSPGYCNWDVAEQHKLFSFFPAGSCGISLTDSALMYPIKSISGMVGVGANVKFQKYTCDLCNQKDCLHRIHLQKMSRISG